MLGPQKRTGTKTARNLAFPPNFCAGGAMLLTSRIVRVAPAPNLELSVFRRGTQAKFRSEEFDFKDAHE
jgi:hypothetical protein